MPISVYAQWERVGPISFTSISSKGASEYVMCTDAGTVYTTTDSGKTWQSQIIDLKRMFTSINFYDKRTGAVGSDSGKINVTNDAGKTWTETSLENDNSVIGVSWLSRDTVVSITSDACWQSVDKGNLWKKIHPPEINNFIAIHSDQNYITVIGCSGGKLLINNNGGNKWNVKQLPTTDDVLSVDCRRSGNIVVGTSTSGVFQSQDNGNTWVNTFKSNIASDSLFNLISSIAFFDDSSIVAFQRKSIKYIKSIDFGKTWSFVLLSKDSSENLKLLNDFQFMDISTNGHGEALLCGSFGTVYQLKNENGATKFLHHCSMGLGITPYTSQTVYISPISNTPKHIKALCNRGPMGISADVGVSWLSRYVINTGGHAAATYFGLHFTDENNGVLFTKTGKLQYFYPFVNTSDNGKNWQTQVVDSPRGNFTRSTVDSFGNIFIIGDSSIFVSQDKGFHWNMISKFFMDENQPTNRKQLSSILNAIQAVDDSVIVVSAVVSDSLYSGKNFNDIYVYHSALGISTDLGRSWKTTYLPDTTMLVYDLYFLSPQVGFVNVGVPTTPSAYLERKVLKTLDGGSTWTAVPEIYSNFTLGDMSFSKDKRIGIVAGDQGEIYTSTDSGNTWNTEVVTYLNDRNQRVGLLHPYFVDDSTVLVTSLVGFWRKVIHPSSVSEVHFGATSNQYLDIRLNPTPVQGGILHCSLYGLYSVDLKEDISVIVYDILGRAILDESHIARSSSNGYSSTFDIQTKELSNGVYTIVFHTSNGETTRKFLVSKQ